MFSHIFPLGRPDLRDLKGLLASARFRACCDRAFSSALHLASWAGDLERSSLKRYYEESVNVEWFQSMGQDLPEDEDEDEFVDDEEEMARNPPLTFTIHFDKF